VRVEVQILTVHYKALASAGALCYFGVMDKIEVLLFGGPMDGKTMDIPFHTQFIEVPYIMIVARDEIGRFTSDPESLVGHYEYDRERTVHSIISEPTGGRTEHCYRWEECGH
jgi:hypothetical protein